MRIAVLLSIFFLLTSCSTFNQHQETELPQKVFQYSYQAPRRTLVSADGLKQLRDAKATQPYFSASGYQCRKYHLSSKTMSSACKIAGRWYSTSPILSAN